MKIRDITTARLRHSVAEAGSGAPLMLLHGFTGAKEDFTDVLDAFADRGWHAVAPDQRGHGGSDAPDDEEEYSLAILGDDAVALADALGWGSFALLGHSMGGMAAQVVALAHPARISSLVLMDTCPGPVSGVDPELVEAAVHLVRTEGVDRLLAVAAALDTRVPTPSEVRVRAERPGYGAFGDRKLRASAAAMYASMAPQLVGAADRSVALDGLVVPTLVVVGEEDAGFLPGSRQLADAIPGARLEVIPDAAHAPQFENTDRWWRVVSRFLDGVHPAAPVEG